LIPQLGEELKVSDHDLEQPFEDLLSDEVPADEKTLYDWIISVIFEEKRRHVGLDADEVFFSTNDVRRTIADLEVEIGNPFDIPYTYRTNRRDLPLSILQSGNWSIEAVSGKGNYVFRRLSRSPYIDIPEDLATTEILDGTPGIVLKYQKSDEQALLARVRYNRLIDIFTGLAAFHLQGHFRTTVNGSQVEIDDLYIGVDTEGNGYLLPIEAKSVGEHLGVSQITGMVKFARERYPTLPLRPIGLIVMLDESLMFLEFNTAEDSNEVRTERYKRYKLVRE
jgi:hypothetical protein